MQRFGNRVFAYLALMDDRYPATDDHQSVRLDYSYPGAAELNRWLPLVKWLLAIPHYIVLFFLEIAAFFAVVIAWIEGDQLRQDLRAQGAAVAGDRVDPQPGAGGGHGQRLDVLDQRGAAVQAMLGDPGR